ncbi:hypothetical protein BH10PSE14_BH10PSE14_08840 [soil metagenome]
MSDDRSARLALPLLAAGQAQKEVTHNEAAILLDLLVQPAVVAVGADTPPTAPDEGDCWILGTSPTGDWAGHAKAIAGWTAGGWRFAAPIEGMTAWVAESGCAACFAAGSWIMGDLAGARVVIDGVPVVGAQSGAITEPTGGSFVDAEARSAITSILAALRGHGLVGT